MVYPSYCDLMNYVNDPATPHRGGHVKEGDAWCHCPSVWDYVIDRFGIKSVLDLGSGMGHASAYFFRYGLAVVSVDGLTENVDEAIYPAIRCDLTKDRVYTRVDLVHCHEVVEHIEAQFLDNLLSSLTCGKFILMTHAGPGQNGYHHVNLQPQEYWVNHLRDRNCHLLEEDTKRIRELAQKEGAGHMARSGLLLVNRSFK